MRLEVGNSWSGVSGRQRGGQGSPGGARGSPEWLRAHLETGEAQGTSEGEDEQSLPHPDVLQMKGSS